jgi:hypothetical protein
VKGRITVGDDRRGLDQNGGRKRTREYRDVPDL